MIQQIEEASFWLLASIWWIYVTGFLFHNLSEASDFVEVMIAFMAWYVLGIIPLVLRK